MVQFDVATLDEEHRDFVRTLQDKIAEGDLALEQQEFRTRSLTETAEDLKRQNEDLSIQIRSLTAQREKLDSEYRHANADLIRYETQLKSEENVIHSNMQTLKLAETALGGLLIRKAEIEQSDQGIMELASIVQSLQAEIDLIRCEIDRVTEILHDLEDDGGKSISEMDRERRGNEESVNWHEEKLKIEAEIERLKKLSSDRSKSEQNDRNYWELHSRYRGLVPLFQKWSGKMNLGEDWNESSSIDELLRQCGRECDGDVKRVCGDLEGETIHNWELEAVIVRKREELDRLVKLFRGDVQKLKNKIHSVRICASDEEHAVTEQIKDLKIKQAQRRLKI
jgi:DNA repair exonuclease SbcCD ATPase subunit